ncbi:MAG: hypothetical protein ABR538_13045 [Candidatus Binatia bacterium]
MSGRSPISPRVLSFGLGAFLVLLALATSQPAKADPCSPVAPVFDGDPCDPLTGPLPMMPGLPLVLPPSGPTGLWSEGPPVVTPDLVGDVDLAVRVGVHAGGAEVPAPSGSANNPSLLQNIAGGGNLQGVPVPFTAFVTDGPGSLPYGAPLAGLDTRPLAAFAYADLDGDGIIGPTDTDGAIDNEIERQEAIGHVGRQVGQIDGDRFHNSLAVRVGAPASIGGLLVSLVAGMYTGDDPDLLWSNGTPIFTNWPFFPPVDPLAVVFLAEANPPDPDGPNILFYQPSEFLLPEPSTPQLVEAFSLRTDGSNPSTDQFVSISGLAVGARLFRDVVPANFTASSRLVARPAPARIGSGRKLVVPAGEVVVKSGRNVVFRLLPVDALGNIADPGPGGVPARLEATGGLEILSPDADGDPFAETLSVETARGVVIRLETTGVTGRHHLTVLDPPPAVPIGLDQALVFASSSGAVDTDDDGLLDDGDDSGTIGDRPCTAADVVAGIPCDDNCYDVINPSQNDSDGDGQGNCCDGACVIDDGEAGCLECPQSAARFRAVNTRARVAIRPSGDEERQDVVRIRALLRKEEGQSLAPDSEEVEITIGQGDRLHYFAQLPGLFSLIDPAPTYRYEDPTGSNGGILRAQLRTRRRGLKARILARQFELVDTAPGEELPGGLVLAVAIGDDTFARHLKCTASLSRVRCLSGD